MNPEHQHITADMLLDRGYNYSTGKSYEVLHSTPHLYQKRVIDGGRLGP